MKNKKTTLQQIEHTLIPAFKDNKLVKSMHLNPDMLAESEYARSGYGNGLVEAGKQNKNVCVLCCDLTESTKSNYFKSHFPERFVEIGVAEQNMAGIAAGMASEGKIPFMSSYAVFNPGRNFDQIRVSICYSNLHVIIAGAHAGISVGPDGATHQALEDISMMRVLPNMVVLVGADYDQVKKLTMLAANKNNNFPIYLRFGREKIPKITTEKTPCVIGKADIYRQGRDCVIIACGPMVYEALIAAKE